MMVVELLLFKYSKVGVEDVLREGVMGLDSSARGKSSIWMLWGNTEVARWMGKGENSVKKSPSSNSGRGSSISGRLARTHLYLHKRISNMAPSRCLGDVLTFVSWGWVWVLDVKRDNVRVATWKKDRWTITSLSLRKLADSAEEARTVVTDGYNYSKGKKGKFRDASQVGFPLSRVRTYLKRGFRLKCRLKLSRTPPLREKVLVG